MPISIHALLAESDWNNRPAIVHTWKFLSTLSLRRATMGASEGTAVGHNFYPRSPCGERRHYSLNLPSSPMISIHALLAESDHVNGGAPSSSFGNFYPRSPCGERLLTLSMGVILISFLSTLSLRRATLAARDEFIMFVFLSTLSLRRATCLPGFWRITPEISIHALLAESDKMHALKLANSMLFLSTLSLRRATGIIDIINDVIDHFYPRSPCGERPYQLNEKQANQSISIHALLAESDAETAHQTANGLAFLSTLSLRRATSIEMELNRTTINFYPRSPCGERRIKPIFCEINARDFYPRSPCGERRPL